MHRWGALRELGAGDREGCADQRALPGCTLYREVTTDLCGAFAHRAEPEVAGEVAAGVEADTVVANLEREYAEDLAEGDVHDLRAGMLHGVVHRLLSDPLEGFLRREWDLRLSGEGGIHLEPVPLA